MTGTKKSTQEYKYYFENRVPSQLTTSDIIHEHDHNYLEASKKHWLRLLDYRHKFLMLMLAGRKQK